MRDGHSSTATDVTQGCLDCIDTHPELRILVLSCELDGLLEKEDAIELEIEFLTSIRFS